MYCSDPVRLILAETEHGEILLIFQVYTDPFRGLALTKPVRNILGQNPNKSNPDFGKKMDKS